MEELIEQYLFHHRQCPLPEIGSLVVKERKAVIWHHENKIAGPVPYIELTDSAPSPTSFHSFISRQLGISHDEAITRLNDYCGKLKKMQAGMEVRVNDTGRFIVNNNGQLIFEHQEIPVEFVPAIPVTRVSHTNAAHDLRVGDNFTTNTAMSAYYSGNAARKKERWWIWALILTVIAVALVFFYYNTIKPGGTFGSSLPLSPKADESSYQSR